ncbi:MAG: YebC/PmpR family DNA-binding transcriptional regulator [Bdellovibrionales bacterium]
MAGHSKWANIRHKKGAADAKRSKMFTKIAKEVTVAARLGGGDVDANPRLRRAITSARAVSMPKDNIDRAVKKGTGDLDGVSFEEVTFEGYGPNGVAIMVDCLTDNRNRVVSEIRFAFKKGKGAMGESGSVAWIFEEKGVIAFSEMKDLDVDKLQELAIENGADDIEEEEDGITIYSAVDSFDELSEILEKAGFQPQRSEIAKIPSNTIEVEGEAAEGVFKLINLLEDLDDVQNVSANFDVSDEELERILA